jgi:hypothetical protein
MSNQEVLGLWAALKEIVDQIDVDVRKNSNGNASAGVRARKGLRIIRAKAAELTKITIDLEKAKKQQTSAE